MGLRLAFGAEVGDVTARAFAGLAKSAGKVVAHERRRADRVGRGFEAALDRGTGAVHAFAEDGETVDGLADGERQEREQHEEQEEEQVTGKRRGAARRDV